jgi:XapX domain-containing protein
MTKSFIGLTLAFVIGFACRAFDIPSPAPPVLVGALLVVAMTMGYIIVDRVMALSARQAINYGGPSGLAPNAVSETVSGTAPKNAKHRQVEVQYARLIYSFVTSRAVHFIGLLGLCSPYIQGGLAKLFDFGAAIDEVQHFGLPAASGIAAATVITELAASAAILTGFYRWVGALLLAAFTLVATFVANRYWEIPLANRVFAENSFFEHIGLVGAFLLVACYDLRNRTSNMDR